jgi:hypothetical protein
MIYKIASVLAIVLVAVLVVPSVIANFTMLTKTIRSIRSKPYRGAARYR